LEGVSIVDLAAQIRAERAELAACRRDKPQREPGETAADRPNTAAEATPTPAADLEHAELLSNAIRIRSSDAIRVRRRKRRRPHKDVLTAADEQLREPV
ncbi:MAG: hypothetical protein ACRDKX_00665, partial [Solirubrobacterales bacterium]